MPDFRINTIIFNLVLNALFPLFSIGFFQLLKKKEINSLPFIPYAFGILIFLILLIHIYTKKTNYSKIYLRKTYIPSTKLFVVVFFFDLLIICGIYFAAFLKYKYITNIILGSSVLHTLMMYISFMYIYQKNNKPFNRIKLLDTNFKLGIMAKQVGGDNQKNLKKNEIVKIMKTLNSGYIVKNSKGEEYMVEKADIEEVIDIS